MIVEWHLLKAMALGAAIPFLIQKLRAPKRNSPYEIIRVVKL